MTTIVNPHPHFARVAGAVLGLAALLVAMVLTANPASSHSRLEATSPNDGSSLTATPPEVMLRFNEPVEKSLSQVTVKSGSKDATRGSLEVEGNTVYQPLKTSLAPGSFKVVYKVVSADGHPVSGTFSFSYDPPEGDTGAAADPSATSSSPSASSSPTSESASPSPDSSTATTPSDGEIAPDEPDETSASTSTDPDADAQEADDADEDEGTSGWVWALAAAVLVIVLTAIGLVLRARRGPRDEEDVTLED